MIKNVIKTGAKASAFLIFYVKCGIIKTYKVLLRRIEVKCNERKNKRITERAFPGIAGEG